MIFRRLRSPLARLARAGIAALLAIAGSAALTPSASAGGAPVLVTTTTDGATVTSVVTWGGRSSVTSLTCTITANNPFRFWGGSGGGVQGLANIQCTQAVPRLDITVGLYRYNNLVSVKSRTSYQTTLITNDAAISPYSSGQYATGAIGTVYWPDGTTYSFPQVNSSVVNL